MDISISLCSIQDYLRFTFFEELICIQKHKKIFLIHREWWKTSFFPQIHMLFLLYNIKHFENHSKYEK